MLAVSLSGVRWTRRRPLAQIDHNFLVLFVRVCLLIPRLDPHYAHIMRRRGSFEVTAFSMTVARAR